MSSISVAGDTSGSVTLQAPSSAGSTVLTLPAQTGTVMVNGPAFSAYQSVAQTITSSTFTKINFNTEAWDTNSNYDTSTYRFTPTVAGYYMVTCAIDAGASTAATLVLTSIYKNGSVYRYGNYLTTIAGNTYESICSSQVYMNGSTDYIECYGYITASVAIASPSSGTWFDACLVRSA